VCGLCVCVVCVCVCVDVGVCVCVCVCVCMCVCVYVCGVCVNRLQVPPCPLSNSHLPLHAILMSALDLKYVVNVTFVQFMPVKEPTPGHTLGGPKSGSGCFGVKCLFLAGERFPVSLSQNTLTCLCTLPISVNHFGCLCVRVLCIRFVYLSSCYLLIPFIVYMYRKFPFLVQYNAPTTTAPFIHVLCIFPTVFQ